MIDTSNWKDYRVGDLFDIHPTKAYKMTNLKLLDGGDNPVIVNSAYNNGIGGYSSQKTTEKGNMITFSDTVDANTIFYQPNDFVGYPHVQGLYPIKYQDKWNEYTYLFFISIFRGSAISKGFDYGNKFRRDIAVELMIKLPTTLDGHPDWNYMESYMKQIIEESEKKLGNLKKIDNTKHMVNVSGWGIFKVRDLFDIHPTAAYKMTNKELMNDNGVNPVIVNSGFNNGVGCFTNQKCTEKAGVITFTDTAAKSSESFFFQNKDFVGYPHVQGMYCKHHDLNEYEGKFIATVLRSAAGKFDFITKMTRDEVLEFDIMLPITDQNEPDWNYIVNYMKTVIDNSNQLITNLNIGLI